jgi:hypothetical protein
MNERSKRVAPSAVSGLIRADLVGGPLGGRNVTVAFQPGGVIVGHGPGRYLWGRGNERGKLVWKDVANVPAHIPAIVLVVPHDEPTVAGHLLDEASCVAAVFGMAVAVASAIGIVYLIMRLVT